MASAMVQVNVRIPPLLHGWLVEEARKEGATVTAIVTRALFDYQDAATGRREKGAA